MPSNVTPRTSRESTMVYVFANEEVTEEVTEEEDSEDEDPKDTFFRHSTVIERMGVDLAFVRDIEKLDSLMEKAEDRDIPFSLSCTYTGYLSVNLGTRSLRDSAISLDNPN